MSRAGVLARFSGPATCRIDPNGPLGLTLVGEEGAVTTHVAFVCAAPVGWPARLERPLVEREAAGRFRVSAQQASLAVEASAVFVHRDVTAAFERAVPPRRAPFAKRVFWRALLAFAATGVGRRALHTLRG